MYNFGEAEVILILQAFYTQQAFEVLIHKEWMKKYDKILTEYENLVSGIK